MKKRTLHISVLLPDNRSACLCGRKPNHHRVFLLNLPFKSVPLNWIPAQQYRYCKQCEKIMRALQPIRHALWRILKTPEPLDAARVAQSGSMAAAPRYDKVFSQGLKWLNRQ